MKNYFFAAIAVLVFSGFAHGQRSGNLMIGGGLDLIKSDFNEFGGKVQMGFEVNYFIISTFSVSGGAEFWTQGSNSLAIGMRWYPVSNVFFRFRGLIGENDISTGLGFSKPLNKNWRLETTGDYYFVGDFGVRLGVAYLLK